MNRKLLAPLRLSHYKDSSVNPEGQRARIMEYAEDHGDDVIFVDVDMDVSGAVPIRERPGLGPWLAPDRISELDGFVADEMDRLSRDMLDYLQYARDMAALGKVIIDVSDGTDTSTERGRQALEDRILAAQRERERAASRRRKAATRLSDAGRWGGGKPGYGDAPSCLCHEQLPCPDPQLTIGWGRVLLPVEAPVVKWMVQQRITGRGFRSIAIDLNEQGVPAPRGGKWNATTVGKILMSPLLLGHVVEMKGETGIKGMPGYRKPSRPAPRPGDRPSPDTCSIASSSAGRARRGRLTPRRACGCTAADGIRRHRRSAGSQSSFPRISLLPSAPSSWRSASRPACHCASSPG